MISALRQGDNNLKNCDKPYVHDEEYQEQQETPYFHASTTAREWRRENMGFVVFFYGRIGHLWGKIFKTKKPLPRGGILEFLNKNFTGGLQTAQRVFWLKRIFLNFFVVREQNTLLCILRLIFL